MKIIAKYIANILTIIRIILSFVLLFFFDEVNAPFLIIFTIAEFTDMIDGTIARKTNTSSVFGSVLDTVADVLLASNIVKVVIRVNALQGGLLIWFIAIVIIAILAPIIYCIKFKKVYFVHTVLSKILGGAICLIPFDVFFGGVGNYLIICLVIFALSMIESVLIAFVTKNPDPNTKSLYHAIKHNK